MCHTRPAGRMLCMPDLDREYKLKRSFWVFHPHPCIVEVWANALLLMSDFDVFLPRRVTVSADDTENSSVLDSSRGQAWRQGCLRGRRFRPFSHRSSGKIKLQFSLNLGSCRWIFWSLIWGRAGMNHERITFNPCLVNVLIRNNRISWRNARSSATTWLWACTRTPWSTTTRASTTPSWTCTRGHSASLHTGTSSYCCGGSSVLQFSVQTRHLFKNVGIHVTSFMIVSSMWFDIFVAGASARSSSGRPIPSRRSLWTTSR